MEKDLGEGLFRDSDGFCAREWQIVRNADIVAEIRKLLRNGDLRLAIVIWKRHYLGRFLPSRQMFTSR